MEAFGKFCFALIAIVFSTLIGGFVFMTLWKWFIASTFEIRQLTLIQSIGIMVFINWIKPKSQGEKTDQKATEKLAKAMMDIAVYAIVALIFGWIIQQFM